MDDTHQEMAANSRSSQKKSNDKHLEAIFLQTFNSRKQTTIYRTVASLNTRISVTKRKDEEFVMVSSEQGRDKRKHFH